MKGEFGSKHRGRKNCGIIGHCSTLNTKGRVFSPKDYSAPIKWGQNWGTTVIDLPLFPLERSLN